MAGQPDSTPKGAGVKALSSRLLQMKFMKRGQVAEAATKAASSRVDVQASHGDAACDIGKRGAYAVQHHMPLHVCRMHLANYLRTRNGSLRRHKGAALSYQSRIPLQEPCLGIWLLEASIQPLSNSRSAKQLPQPRAVHFNGSNLLTASAQCTRVAPPLTK